MFRAHSIHIVTAFNSILIHLCLDTLLRRGYRSKVRMVRMVLMKKRDNVFHVTRDNKRHHDQTGASDDVSPRI